MDTELFLEQFINHTIICPLVSSLQYHNSQLSYSWRKTFCCRSYLSLCHSLLLFFDWCWLDSGTDCLVPLGRILLGLLSEHYRFLALIVQLIQILCGWMYHDEFFLWESWLVWWWTHFFGSFLLGFFLCQMLLEWVESGRNQPYSFVVFCEKHEILWFWMISLRICRYFCSISL